MLVSLCCRSVYTSQDHRARSRELFPHLPFSDQTHRTSGPDQRIQTLEVSCSAPAHLASGSSHSRRRDPHPILAHPTPTPRRAAASRRFRPPAPGRPGCSGPVLSSSGRAPGAHCVRPPRGGAAMKAAAPNRRPHGAAAARHLPGAAPPRPPPHRSERPPQAKRPAEGQRPD